jgi:DNA-binding transcriptional MerR regulator
VIDVTYETLRLRSDEVAAATGISYRQLDYWVRCGLVTCDHDPAGSGNPRTFDPAVVPYVALIGRLVHQLGIAPALAAYVAAQLRDGRTAEVGDFTITQNRNTR